MYLHGWEGRSIHGLSELADGQGANTAKCVTLSGDVLLDVGRGYRIDGLGW